MNGNLWINRIFSACLSVALLVSYSSAALGNSEKIVGEISVGGKTVQGQNLFVKINGENVQSGRSVFTGSTIATPDNASAIISFGKAGRIELTPSTIIQLSFDNEGIKGNLSAGRITILNSAKSVSVTTLDGQTVAVNEGDSASASNAQAQTDDENGGGSLLIYAAILGGAVAGIIFAATRDNKIALGNGSTTAQLGGGAIVVSTTR